MKVTTCLLDPFPASSFKSCLDSLCPAVLVIDPPRGLGSAVMGEQTSYVDLIRKLILLCFNFLKHRYILV